MGTVDLVTRACNIYGMGPRRVGGVQEWGAQLIYMVSFVIGMAFHVMNFINLPQIVHSSLDASRQFGCGSKKDSF